MSSFEAGEVSVFEAILTIVGIFALIKLFDILCISSVIRVRFVLMLVRLVWKPFRYSKIMTSLCLFI